MRAIAAVASVLVAARVRAALDYSLGPEIPESQYDGGTLQHTGEDTFEYMDNLKEDVDASITPLSDMKSMSSLDDDINEEDRLEETTQFDPHEYIKARTVMTEYAQLITTAVETRKGKRKGRVGRPRKSTIFPVQKDKEGVTRASRKRMKWTHNMNKFIMYTYFYVTKLETEKNQYRRKMREKFLEAYPDWKDITEQRLADQKRAITQNRLIDIETMREIKRTVRSELQEKGVVVEEAAVDSRDRSFYD